MEKEKNEVEKVSPRFWISIFIIVILITLFTYYSSFILLYLNYGNHLWNSPKDVIEASFSDDEEIFELNVMEYYKNKFGDEKFHQLLIEILQDNKDFWSLASIAEYTADSGECSLLPYLKERCEYIESLPEGISWSTNVKLIPNYSRISSNTQESGNRAFFFKNYHLLRKKCNKEELNTFENSNKNLSDSIGQPSIKLNNWDRKYFEQPLHNPFISYVVYGDFGDFGVDYFEFPNNKYNTNGIPEHFHFIKNESNPSSEIPGFMDDKAWEKIRSSDPELANQIYSSEKYFFIMGEISDRNNLNYLRDIIGVITYTLDNGGVGVYDSQIGHFWKINEWKNRIFIPNSPVPSHHVKILQSIEEGDTKWFYTVGMRKFGRPDLSIHKVPSRFEKTITDLFSQYIEFQALGGIIKDGQLVENDSLPAGMWCENRGDFEDPNFYNKYLEIHWP